MIAGRERGLAVYGAEIFTSHLNRTDVETTGLLGREILEVDGDRLPFADGYFDLVVANEVFEHVDDLELVLHEIRRVLRPGGALLALFPSRGVVREGHIGIPGVHWLPKGAFRLRYATLLRRLGLGHNKGKKTPARWATDALAWLDADVTYRSKRAALAPFQRLFRIRMIEEHYVGFRLRADPRLRPLAPLLRLPLAVPTARLLVRLGAGMVVLAEKSGT